MRAIGIDLGERRIGVAVSDPSGMLATPHSLLAVPTGSTPQQTLAAQLPELVEQLAAEVVVLGLPLSLSGQSGPAAQQAAATQQVLAELLEVDVLLHDERHTTTIAEQALQQSSLSGSKRRAKVDKIAAAVMLQSWLDLQTARQV